MEKFGQLHELTDARCTFGKWIDRKKYRELFLVSTWRSKNFHPFKTPIECDTILSQQDGAIVRLSSTVPGSLTVSVGYFGTIIHRRFKLVFEGNSLYLTNDFVSRIFTIDQLVDFVRLCDGFDHTILPYD